MHLVHRIHEIGDEDGSYPSRTYIELSFRHALGHLLLLHLVDSQSNVFNVPIQADLIRLRRSSSMISRIPRTGVMEKEHLWPLCI